MENPEEILHSLEEFAKLKPKDIPRELEEYLCFVAKTGDPVYQWSLIKSLFREKLINVITEFYESCPSVDIPPCPNVDLFNYDNMKTFILEKLDTFVAAPFTVQRICELLTTPRKEYNRIDKYMRALEKNILVVSTTEPGNHRPEENGDGFVNSENEHILVVSSTEPGNHRPEESGDGFVNNEHIENYSMVWPANESGKPFQSTSKNQMVVCPVEVNAADSNTTTNTETVITSCPSEEQPFVSIEPVNEETKHEEDAVMEEGDVSVTITAIPAAVQKRRDSIEPPSEQPEETQSETPDVKEETTSSETPPETTETDKEPKVESTETVLESAETIKEIEVEKLQLEDPVVEKVADVEEEPKEEESVCEKPEVQEEVEPVIEDKPVVEEPPKPQSPEKIEEIEEPAEVEEETLDNVTTTCEENVESSSSSTEEPPPPEKTKTEELPATETKEVEVEQTSEATTPASNDSIETPMEVDVDLEVPLVEETAETSTVDENQ